MPFVEELAAPSLRAEMNHIIQAFFAMAGLFCAKKAFFSSVILGNKESAE
jgi:hypothetical protein